LKKGFSPDGGFANEIDIIGFVAKRVYHYRYDVGLMCHYLLGYSALNHSAISLNNLAVHVGIIFDHGFF